MIETYLKLLDQGFFEVKFVFERMADDIVWRRPAKRLLSAGELAAHIAYWEAVRLAGEGGEQDPEAEGISPVPDLAKCRVNSPLVDHRFADYSTTIATPPSDQHLAVTAEYVFQELLRVHGESVAQFKLFNVDLDSAAPGSPLGWTYCSCLEYRVYHVAYHTGQMYSVRHLLGEQTPDN